MPGRERDDPVPNQNNRQNRRVWNPRDADYLSPQLQSSQMMPHLQAAHAASDIYNLSTEQRLQLIQDLKGDAEALRHAVNLLRDRYLDQMCRLFFNKFLWLQRLNLI